PKALAPWGGSNGRASGDGRPRRPDLADLCRIRMSELRPRHIVVTTDRADFEVYRRNRGEAIPLLLPPER
ncbi:MAG: hypothetical protein ACRD1A_12770, partial [Terriglobales bacterium]